MKKICKFCKAVKNNNIPWYSDIYHTKNCEKADKEGVNMRLFNYLQGDDNEGDFFGAYKTF